MHVLWYLFLLGGVITLIDGFMRGNVSYVLGGAGAIAVFYFIWRSRRAAGVLEMLQAHYPGSNARLDTASDAAGSYIVVNLVNIAPESAPEVVEDLRGAVQVNSPGSRLAVVVRDSSGGYWGTDWTRRVPPQARYEYECEADRVQGNPFMEAAIKSGSCVRTAEGKVYKVHPAAPWGPLPQPAPVGYHDAKAE